MGNKRNETGQSLPVANYSSAIARAVDWLGDRYLLAKPINARPGRGTRAASDAPMGMSMVQGRHSNTRHVVVAVAQRVPSLSNSLPSANAARFPLETTRPSARTGPLESVSARW